MPSVGLDISSHSVRVVELIKKSDNTLILGRHAERKIPASAIYSEDIQTNQEVSKVLQALRRELHLRFVDVSLPEEKAYLFTTSVPNLPDIELRQAIEFQLEENVPISPAEAIFDYTILSQESVAETNPAMQTSVQQLAPKTVEVAVVVFPKKIIENTVKLLESAGLKAMSFSIAADAIAQAVIHQDSRETIMIVNLGEKNTGIYVVSNGTVEFTSTLNFGGEALTSAIKKQYSVGDEEAIRMKRTGDFLQDKHAMDLFFSVMNPVSALRDEINRVVIYWQTHRGKAEGKNCSRILLCGADSNLRGLDEYLSAMAVDVSVANVWMNAFSFDRFLPDISFTDSLNYAAAVGLALQSAR
jgi:type IV pilus assembly protein PilM